MIEFKKDKQDEYWISRWDKMQECYNPDRKERFSTLIGLLKSHLNEPKLILDIGCGTGSLMELCLEVFPAVQVIGIDMDFTLLPLAKARLEKSATQISIIETDLRNSQWYKDIPCKVDAIISATALHWLGKDDLSRLYQEFFNLLSDGGIFLNADHVGSTENSIQKHWKIQKENNIRENSRSEESWNSFWEDYLKDFDEKKREERNRVIGDWKGIEDGLSLSWHFDYLKLSGFQYVDCFYRFFGDAIYGGIKRESGARPALEE